MKNAKQKISVLVLIATLAGSLSLSAFAETVKSEIPEGRPNVIVETTPEVEAKIDELAAQCKAEGLTDEYDIALWMHDWLIYNAGYDYDLVRDTAEGVLLHGSGVCQSYSEAFSLFLDKFGIENIIVVSDEMDHAWNMVKLNGKWCHIDVTWDDPFAAADHSTVTGSENQVYFGMDDTLLARDHVWDRSVYPAATSRDNCYLLRNRGSLNVVSSPEEMTALLKSFSKDYGEEIIIYYVGDDADFSMKDYYQEWFEKYSPGYGVAQYFLSGTTWRLKIYGVGYTNPWGELPDDGDDNNNTTHFTDVAADAWYADAVEYVYENKLMNGVDSDKFGPDGTMTRAMLVTVLWRYAGEEKGYSNNFTDVPEGEWYTDAVAWGAANNIVGGVGDGKFDPNGNVTREQMATILFRYCDGIGLDTSGRASLSDFPDEGDVSDYATDAIRWAVAEGIIGGSDGKLLPQNSATRAQVATIFMRFIENVVKK